MALTAGVNSFNKEEIVAFEEIIEGYEDKLVLSSEVSVYNNESTMMERAGNRVWRPQPYILPSNDGTDQTGNFSGKSQLSVPAELGFEKSVPWEMTALEMRDALQENRLGKSAAQRLASDINVAVMNVASSEGTLVVPVSTAAGTYDDIALCDSIMNEQGVMMSDRCLALSSRDYNGMAGNLVGTARSFDGKKSVSAYERSLVGDVAGFKTFKLDYANRGLAAAGGGSLTIDTQAAATNYLVPAATVASPNGGRSNVDNRTDQITISSTTNVAAGDSFTIAGVEAVHQITKQSTGQLKTFRVVSVDSKATMTISPGIVSNQGSSEVEEQYQNCIVTESATAAITFLNIAASAINPFWHKDAIEILPGHYAPPENAGANIMRGSTEQGLEIVFQKQFDINTMKTKYRVDTLFGVVNKQPEMSGILLFNQV